MNRCGLSLRFGPVPPLKADLNARSNNTFARVPFGASSNPCSAASVGRPFTFLSVTETDEFDLLSTALASLHVNSNSYRTFQ